MHDLERRLLARIRRRALIERGDTVLVALSGGVDSVVLLHLLLAIRAELGCDVCAAHFDHAMRPDSAADAAWVAALCSTLGVPLESARADRLLRSEADARDARYAFLLSAAKHTGARRIATAHHADDQVETVLFRILRGTGLRGLAGIPLRRGALIRPLLPFRKSELEAYARENALEFRTDSSNAGARFARNRIRNQLLPVLESAAPNVRRALVRLAREAARSERAWQRMVAHAKRQVLVAGDAGRTQLARPALLEYDAALMAGVLRQVLREHGVSAGRAQTQQLLDFCRNARSGSALTVAGRVNVMREFDRIVFAPPAAFAAADALSISGERGSGRLTLAGQTYDVAWEVGPPNAATTFDASLLDEDLRLRAWQPGDRLRFAYGSKKLKKLFAERRVPVSARAAVPVLANAFGKVYWVVGVARAADGEANHGRVLNITVSNAQSR